MVDSGGFGICGDCKFVIYIFNNSSCGIFVGVVVDVVFIFGGVFRVLIFVWLFIVMGLCLFFFFIFVDVDYVCVVGIVVLNLEFCVGFGFCFFCCF